jgi:hypothetical protein
MHLIYLNDGKVLRRGHQKRTEEVMCTQEDTENELSEIGKIHSIITKKGEEK